MKTMRQRHSDLFGGAEASAVYSDCMAYRFHLKWQWADTPALYVCMLNPSTATHSVLDPTVSGLIKRAKLWGFGAVNVLNLFGYRATKPADMLGHPQPVGIENDIVIEAVLRQAMDDGCPLICGWGNHGQHLRRDEAVLSLARRASVQTQAFAVNANGTPQHPLYIPFSVRPTAWPT